MGRSPGPPRRHRPNGRLARALDDGPVVYDPVVGVDRRAVEREGPIEAIDGHDHAGAEPARVGENDFHDVSLSRRYYPTGLTAGVGGGFTALRPPVASRALQRVRATHRFVGDATNSSD